jgi:hypothetical protein
MTQLFWAHEGSGLGDVRTCLDALVDRADLDAYQRGWVHRVRGESAWLHARNVGQCLAELEASGVAFEEARASRALCLTRLNAASLSGWAGDWQRGLELVASSRTVAEQLGAGFLVSYGRAVEGMLRAYAGDPEAEPIMRRARDEMAGNPRLVFVSCFVLASLALARGDLDVAREAADAARGLRVVDDLRAAGLGLGSRVAAARGDLDEALRVAEEAHAIASRCKDLELMFGTSEIALAEARAAKGDRDGARDVLTGVTHALDAIASTIAADEQRARFLARPMSNGAIAALRATI